MGSYEFEVRQAARRGRWEGDGFERIKKIFVGWGRRWSAWFVAATFRGPNNVNMSLHNELFEVPLFRQASRVALHEQRYTSLNPFPDWIYRSQSC